jgi:hypothetical protein
MIVSLRGTSGSGKTIIARKLMARVESRPIIEDHRLIGYQCGSFRVLGPYVKPSGGVDVLNRDSRGREFVFATIARWAQLGDIFYEGLLVSNEVSRTVELSKQFETAVIFLTTPLEACLEAINKRRAERPSLFGAEPVNPKKTTEKYNELCRVACRLSDAGVRVILADREEAYQQCCVLLGLCPCPN